MDKAFVQADTDLVGVLDKLEPDELAVLARALRLAASCWLDEACGDVAEIADEFQRLGGHSLPNLFRGHGVRYREIVADVAGEVGADINGLEDVSEVEWRVVIAVVSKALQKLKKRERAEVDQRLRELLGAHSQGELCQLLLKKQIGDEARLNVCALVSMQVLGRLKLTKGSGLGTFGSFFGAGIGVSGGPIGMAIGAAIGGVITSLMGSIWRTPGPAYRATIPAVLLMAEARQRLAIRAVDPLKYVRPICPSCGFAYKYDGQTCKHCGHGVSVPPASDQGHLPTSRLADAGATHCDTTDDLDEACGYRTPAAKAKTRKQIVEECVAYLKNPQQLWRASQLLWDDAVLPRKKGAYAWYFDLKADLPFDNPIRIDNRALLYVGIAGERPESDDTIHTRVIRQHLKGAGNAEGSTLRLSVGCLLKEGIGIRLQRKGAKTVWFGEDGEARLSRWLELNTSLAWVTDDQPWEIEQAAFGEYGEKLLLNIRDNSANPFAKILSRVRTEAKREALDTGEV